MKECQAEKESSTGLKQFVVLKAISHEELLFTLMHFLVLFYML